MSHFMTGVAVPVFSLRTRLSCGVGEFADLVPLGRWCARLGLEVIQILPVNDTGPDNSPYSAVSALALHPLYIRLDEMAGVADVKPRIEAFRQVANRGSRVDYQTVLAFKMEVLRAIYDRRYDAISADAGLRQWIRDNPWIRPYAVFLTLKATYGQKHWRQWPAWRDPEDSEIEAYFESCRMQTYFYAWTQCNLEQQLRNAAMALDEMGLALKGDLPIMMHEDSADVWSYRTYFDLSVSAGAPPDMFSPHGQNWGFPVYAWEAHRRDGFRWWRSRMAQAAKFFHAIRIDHVLGFFRIWQIPVQETSGLMGHFAPFRLLSQNELARHFDAGRRRWLSVPHVSWDELQRGLPDDAQHVRSLYLDQLPGEEMFILKPHLCNERALAALPEPEPVKAFLRTRHQDRAFIPMSADGFAPAWYYYMSRSFDTLNETEKQFVNDLITSKHQASEATWEEQGRELLGMIKQATHMLVCAEDLGVVPECVPRVLQALGILSLRIERWAREYKKPDAPYIDPVRYPRLSVCTPSVHDTSTLRAWWAEPDWDRAAYARLLGWDGPLPEALTPLLCRRIIERNLAANSILCVFQIQDLLALTDDLRLEDPQAERINVPGTVGPTNWSYRMPVEVDELDGHEALGALLTVLLEARKHRILTRE